MLLPTNTSPIAVPVLTLEATSSAHTDDIVILLWCTATGQTQCILWRLTAMGILQL